MPEALIEQFDDLWRQSRNAFEQERVWLRAKTLAYSSLVCLGRHTVTGLVTTGGRQFEDWSAFYRLFARERFDSDRLFSVVRRDVLKSLPREAPVVAAMDDSILKKTGKKTAGVAYRRDPLGPPFHTNFVRGQRVLQLSAALPSGPVPDGARMIPIDFEHTPTPQKPRKDAPLEAWQQYRQAQKEMNINRKGVERLSALRQNLDNDPEGDKKALWVVVDGRFTNRTVLKNLPQRTTLIGRIRKDTKLHYLPEPDNQPVKGRKCLYGELAPTPEQLKQDPDVAWDKVDVWAAGKVHSFKVKTITSLRWRPAGADTDLRLIVVAPLAYRLRKGSGLLYRKPAYLICTDPDIPIKQVLQAYVWRWDIEVNFRDEKTILGVGQAQVRTESSVAKVPQFMVATYAMMLLAAYHTYGSKGIPDALPPPKWRKEEKPRRASTQHIINQFRSELWGKALGYSNFSGFKNRKYQNMNHQNITPHLPSAVLYANA